MKVLFDNSFYKKLTKIKDKTILEKVKATILGIESAEDIRGIDHIKKMEGFKTFYRIRIGEYRIGVSIVKYTVTFITIANRKDIYKNFP